jgi:hypothetical protein
MDDKERRQESIDSTTRFRGVAGSWSAFPQVVCNASTAAVACGSTWGTNMNDIVARILLFLACASIMVGTMGWYGNAHLVLR